MNKKTEKCYPASSLICEDLKPFGVGLFFIAKYKFTGYDGLVRDSNGHFFDITYKMPKEIDRLKNGVRFKGRLILAQDLIKTKQIR